MTLVILIKKSPSAKKLYFDSCLSFGLNQKIACLTPDCDEANLNMQPILLPSDSALPRQRDNYTLLLIARNLFRRKVHFQLKLQLQFFK